MSYQLGQIIFKIDSTGKTREWQIDVEETNGLVEIVTLAGIQGSPNKVPTRVPVYEGKNIGKSNETTPYTQAIAEALATAEHKLRGQYRVELNSASKGELRGGKAPMLAQKFHPEGLESSSKTLTQMKIEGGLIHVQPKLDGLRCVATVNPTEVKLRTRGGDPFEPIPHIEAEFRFKYDALGLIGEYEFDGELYTTEITFSEISGALRKQKKTAEHLKNLQYVKFHVYDVMMPVGYGERYKFIYSIFGQKEDSPIQMIPSYEITATNENINAKMAEFLADGNEGLMIRTLDTPYDNKRSWQLCKYKHFQDAEYELADIIEDARGGFVGAFVMKCEPYTDRNGKQKDTFNAGVKDLTQAEGAKMLANKQDYIGKQGTVRFQILSDYNIPLFPKFVGIRWDAESQTA